MISISSNSLAISKLMSFFELYQSLKLFAEVICGTVPFQPGGAAGGLGLYAGLLSPPMFCSTSPGRAPLPFM